MLSLPAFLRLVGLLLLPLPFSSHLLQLLSVFPLDEALLMSHLWEVIWYGRGGGGERGIREKSTKKNREKRDFGIGDEVSNLGAYIALVMVFHCKVSTLSLWSNEAKYLRRTAQ